MGWRKVWVDVDPTGDVIVKLPANATPEVPKALLGTPRHVWVQALLGGDPTRCDVEVFATFEAAKGNVPFAAWRYDNFGTWKYEVDHRYSYIIRKHAVGP